MGVCDEVGVLPFFSGDPVLLPFLDPQYLLKSLFLDGDLKLQYPGVDFLEREADFAVDELGVRAGLLHPLAGTVPVFGPDVDVRRLPQVASVERDSDVNAALAVLVGRGLEG